MVAFGDARLPERFWAKVEPEPNTGCWLWVGACDRGGYPRLLVGRSPALAYRLAYEHTVGSIPSGLEIDHLCRVRCCVNPHHLEAVTTRENTLRSEAFVAKNAKKTHCPRGHQYDILVDTGRPILARGCRVCRREGGRARSARYKQRLKEAKQCQPTR